MIADYVLKNASIYLLKMINPVKTAMMAASNTAAAERSLIIPALL